MESYRVRPSTMNKSRTILLPTSFGISSTSLLYLLDALLESQISRNNSRTGYSLLVVYVNTSAQSDSKQGTLLDDLKARFPRHRYMSVQLSDIYDYNTVWVEELQMSSSTFSNISDSPNTPTNTKRLAALLDSLPSVTSRADIMHVLTTRLLVEIAKAESCDSIAWGDSTTRLAEKTLAETAKGRGFSLPWQLSDGVTPYGLTFNYPLRDVLKKELVSHADMVNPPLTPLIWPDTPKKLTAGVGKNTTIDELMTTYFESVEVDFPSIVANVVRTSGKLDTGILGQSQVDCGLCGLPIPVAEEGGRWGGDQEAMMDDGEVARKLCYGCERSMYG
jgi:cytoplasmic tRNA 2-thiolation protein 2